MGFQCTADGTTTLIHQAAAAGVRKIIVTGSVAAVFNSGPENPAYSDIVLSDQDWNPSTEEEAASGKLSSYKVYCTAKAAQDRSVWKLEREYPEIDFTASEQSHSFL